MVVYHLFFDLNFLGILVVPLKEPPFVVLQRLTAFLFLTLVGVSLTLGRPTLEKTARRFALLASSAMLVTAVTWYWPHDGFIVFGILHLIAASVLLGLLFLRFETLNLFLGLGLLTFGTFFVLPRLDVPWLLWLGFPPAGFYTLDYYPLLPWFGLVLLGIYAGKKVKPYLETRPGGIPSWAHLFIFLGKNALLIYLVHQPVLLGVLSAFRFVTGS